MSEKKEQFSFENKAEYEEYLDSAPNEKWIQKRTLGGDKVHLFLPLFIIDGNADFVYKEWNIIKESPLGIKDGVAFTVTIFALASYPDAQHETFTGSAAVSFKSSGNAVEYDLPSARAKAIGNAFKTKGNVFGRSLNRTYEYTEGGVQKETRIQPDFSLRRQIKEAKENDGE